jgi:ribosome maturation factor RimP
LRDENKPLASHGLLVSMELEKIRGAAERVAHSVGVEVVDIEWKIGKQRLLRVWIDRPPMPGQKMGSGISHSDCQALSDQLSVILDVEELVSGSGYVLEVSSPGLDRKLLKPADYERFSGRLARVWLNEPVENQKYFEGRLSGYADGIVRMSVRDRVMSLPLTNIRKANLVVEL